jgi:23S rRNA pseudouridine2605 synthase
MATKKTTTKSGKPVALKITPIDPESEPKRKRKSAAPAPKPVPTTGIEDPLGEPADGEGKTYLGDESSVDADSSKVASISAETGVDEVKPEPTANNNVPDDAERPFSEAWVADDSPAEEEIAANSTEPVEEPEDESEAALEKRPPAKLERLQKILSQAGIASRRKAEQMIEEGRVQVNGTVVTELGTKADAGRDHIRVDGKLLHGAERHRYFVLNKPRGFVTTVKDPEGRPTVMTFFEKMRERLYPVGRLDYMSEGLLLVTNDGDLANRLTKAGSGVEKTYYVKVAGQPTEEELDRLRGGVMIERGQPGSDRVRTSPARIRQVRQGDNPWYEVVLIEGRNRELRKMFSSIGHFVEKIRRVGYGPLILDVEPGKLRELDPQELEKLKLASEGKLRTPKAKDIRRRDREDAGTYVQPKRVNIRPSYDEPRRADSRPSRPSGATAGRSGAGRFESRRPESGGYEPRRSGPGGARPSGPRPSGGRPSRPFAAGDRGARPNTGRPDVGRSSTGRAGEFRPKPQFGAGKPYQDSKPFQGDRPARPAFRPAGEGDYRSRPATAGRSEGKPFRSGADKGRWKNADGERPRSARTGREQSSDRPRREGASFDKPKFDRPRFDKPGYDKPRYDKAKPGGSAQRSFGAPVRSDRPGSDRPRPPRGNDEFKRPFTPRGEAPRTGGARPAGKPFRPGGQGDSRPAFRSGPRPASGLRSSGARPATGSRPAAGSGSRPSYGAGSSRPASGGPPSRSGGGSSRPPSRGFGKPGEKKTGFQNRGGARSSGRPGGKRRP